MWRRLLIIEGLLLLLLLFSFSFLNLFCGFSLLFPMGVLGSRMVEMLARAGGEGHIDTTTRFGRFRFVLFSLFCITKERSKQVDT
jgi:hypothetical protein